MRETQKQERHTSFYCWRSAQHIQAAGCHGLVGSDVKEPVSLASLIGLSRASPALAGKMPNKQAHWPCPSFCRSPAPLPPLSAPADFLSLPSSAQHHSPPTVPAWGQAREPDSDRERVYHRRPACWRGPFLSPAASLAEATLPLGISNRRLLPLPCSGPSSSSAQTPFLTRANG